MSDHGRRNGSSSSYGNDTAGSDNEQRSVSPERLAKEDAEQNGKNEDHDIDHQGQKSPEKTRPPRHIHFRSQTNLAQEARREQAREDPRVEWDRAHRLIMPHRPSMPYSHDSADIADVTLRDQGEADQGKEAVQQEQPEKAPPEQTAPDAIVPETLSFEYAKRRIRSATEKLKQKASQLGEWLGRPTTGGDDLHPGVYHADWASGSQPPLSDVTDNKHKTDEEKRQHQAQSSSEAHRLVRDLTQSHSAKRRKTRPRPYPHGGMNYIGGEDESALESGLRYRSGGGGILAQLMKLNGGAQESKGGLPSRTPSQSSLSGPASRSDTDSGRVTPVKKNKPPKWYKRPPNTSTSTLAGASGDLSGASTPVSSEVLSAASQRRGKQAERKMNLEVHC